MVSIDLSSIMTKSLALLDSGLMQFEVDKLSSMDNTELLQFAEWLAWSSVNCSIVWMDPESTKVDENLATFKRQLNELEFSEVEMKSIHYVVVTHLAHFVSGYIQFTTGESKKALRLIDQTTSGNIGDIQCSLLCVLEEYND